MLKKQQSKRKINSSLNLNAKGGDAQSSQNNEDKNSVGGASSAVKERVISVVELGLEGIELSDVQGMLKGSPRKEAIQEEGDQDEDNFSEEVQQFLQEINDKEASEQAKAQ